MTFISAALTAPMKERTLMTPRTRLSRNDRLFTKTSLRYTITRLCSDECSGSSTCFPATIQEERSEQAAHCGKGHPVTGRRLLRDITVAAQEFEQHGRALAQAAAAIDVSNRQASEATRV